MGYNFLYGLWKYSWDADCELFLRILEEKIKEDVYTQQIQLQVCISLIFSRSFSSPMFTSSLSRSVSQKISVMTLCPVLSFASHRVWLL